MQYIQRPFTNDRRLLKFTTLKGVRIYSYEFISFLCKTKPKSSSPKINVSSFLINKYVLIGHLVIQTAKPIKANLSQLKPILSQFVEKGKIDAKWAFTKPYEEKAVVGQKNKANSKPIKAN